MLKPRLLYASMPAALLPLCAPGVGAPAMADEVLYRYEADVPPYDPAAGWTGHACPADCMDWVENGHYVLEWVEFAEQMGFVYTVAWEPDTSAPSTLWVEWRYRSSTMHDGIFSSNDAKVIVQYRDVLVGLGLYGDAVIAPFAGVINGLARNEFHLIRFECRDGQHFSFAVDGDRFLEHEDTTPGTGRHTIGVWGRGYIVGGARNEWDFVRYGTISDGEQVAASDPPAGLLDARVDAGRDRFAITFDQPGYVYTDEVHVEVTVPEGYGPPPQAPGVLWTHRRDGDDVDSLEIVLDRPLPMFATTTFTIDTRGSDDDAPLPPQNTLAFTFVPGDADGDGRVTLSDCALFQTCFGEASPPAACGAMDFNFDGRITASDFEHLQPLIDAE